MNTELTARFPTMLAALSQPTRLRIVEVIAAGGPEGVTAGDIARAVHCPASTLSFHLKELTHAGMLEPKPQGRFIRYGLVHHAFAALGTFVAGLPAVAAAPEKPRQRKSGRRGPSGASQPSGATEGQLSIFGE